MSGSALSRKSAVVKLPSPRNPGAKVPTIEPMMSGMSMSPPGILFIPSNNGTWLLNCDPAAMANLLLSGAAMPGVSYAALCTYTMY